MQYLCSHAGSIISFNNQMINNNEQMYNILRDISYTKKSILSLYVEV